MIDRVSEETQEVGQYVAARPAAGSRDPLESDQPDSPLAEFRRSMRRFNDRFASLPFASRATCPSCREVVEAKFDRCAGGVAVQFVCPTCGTHEQFHHDGIYTARASDRPGSPAHTLGGSRIRPALRGLPRTVETLCPECLAIIVGRYFVEGGAVFIEKTCPEHGYFRDCINRDVRLYSKAAWWSFEEHAGQKFPQTCGGGHCPSDCGLCRQHQSSACLANVDLTNRCNMRCPVCFANAGTTGYIYEPSYEQIVAMLQELRDLRPTPCTAVQFSGGEPTLHPDFLKILSAAREMGFSNIQIATNGIRMADLGFAQQAVAAGLHTLYLQFDGIGEEAYTHTRNYPGIWEKKLACVENCRKTGMKICLVPTVVRGVNDSHVGPILQFALQNIDVISAISYQPVSFTGRIDEGELAASRYTLGDLAKDIAQTSGCVPLRDMFPLSIVVPLSQILQALTGKPKIRPSCHTDCAFGTYFLVSPEGKPYPFPQVVDIEGMFSDMNRIAADLERKGGKVTWLDKLKIFRMFKRHFRPQSAPPGLTVARFIRSLQGLVDKGLGRGEGEKFTYKTLLCAGMHFQDAYNYDVERAKRCVILYSTPEGIFPFCTYNCGPAYRSFVERNHSRTLKQASRPSEPQPLNLESTT